MRGEINQQSKHHWLRASLLAFALAALTLGFVGCTLTPRVTNEFPLRSMCSDQAVQAGLVASRLYPVRVGIGEVEGVPHVQGQARIAETWTWILVHNGKLAYSDHAEHGFEPDHYVGLAYYIVSRFGYLWGR